MRIAILDIEVMLDRSKINQTEYTKINNNE